MSQLLVTKQICKRCIKKLQHLHRRSYYSGNGQKWSSKEVRKTFLDYFCVENDHKFVKSSSILPSKEAGTYFTNAGMNQFKPIFQGNVADGSEMSTYKKVANSQKCVRVGGKHNDLNDVGRDLTHHTFFEMLGNWSFGDYGKEEACRLALTLLTEVYKIPMDRLYFTYYEGDSEQHIPRDLKQRLIWLELGVPADRILSFGNKDNFWDMGETGPCGPCTEIHYDHHGKSMSSYKVNANYPEMVEIWNLVFIQYDRKRNGTLTQLPKMHVDTGIGFERMCAVLNGTQSNYDTDLFKPLIDSVQHLTGAPPYQGEVGQTSQAVIDRAYRIIADHIRMATVCISDGVLPGKNHQESKLRMVIYRALYQCCEVLKAKDGLLEHLVDDVVESLGETYPEIETKSELIKEVLRGSEDKYRHHHADWKSNFSKLLQTHPDIKQLDEEVLHKLHAGWFGHQMPVEMIEIMADLHGLDISEEDLKHIYTEKKALGGGTVAKETVYPWLTGDIVDYLQQCGVERTDDSMKYQYEKADDSYDFPDVDGIIMHILNKDNKLVEMVSVDEKIGIIVDKTCFYSQQGGQRGDKGIITTETGTVLITETHSENGYVLHIGHVTEGFIETAQEAILTVDFEFREACMRNHTATHLLNSALRHVLGDDVRQRGSDVSDDKLSFDFSSVKSMTNDQAKLIEDMVNGFVEKKIPLKHELRPLSEAMKDNHIIYMENMDYPSEVFVVDFSQQNSDSVYKSAELCAGTHLLNTGDVGSFCIANLSGVAVYGAKSVVCLTGPEADKAKLKGEEALTLISKLEQALKSDASLDRCTKLLKQTGSLKYDEMPKLVRDEVMKRAEDARLIMNTLQNKQVYSVLKQDLKTLLSNDNIYSVHCMAIKVLPKITKIMNAQTFTKPFVLVVDTSNNTSAYICLPSYLEDYKEKVVEDFKNSVEGTVSLKEDKFVIVKKGGKHTDLFKTTAEKVLSEFSINYQSRVKM